MTESQIQQQTISYLSMIASRHNFVFFSVPNEGIMSVLKMFKVPNNSCYAIVNFFKKMGLLPGVSDIMILHGGKAYCLEMKLPKYRDIEGYGQSKDQIQFQANVEKTGCKYSIAYNFRDVEVILKEWGVMG